MGGMTTDIKLIDEKGLRIDGRRPDEMRPLKIEAGVLKRADGSAYVEWGLNKVMAAVYGPRECHPRHLQNPERALVQCIYNMASFSVDDRKRPGPDRRSHEISKIIAEALTNVVFTEYFPRTSIDVYIEVLQANAGTRCAGLTAAAVALADAGVPMRDLVASCAAGKVADTVVLDLGKEDIPVGYVPRTNEIVLLQMDGDLTQDEFTKGLNMAVGACKKVYEVQKDALKRRYSARSVDEGIPVPAEEKQEVA
jgi:exosome complex component RRP41